MQKAIVVRLTVEDGEPVGRSFEVDPCNSGPHHPLRRLLAAGWQVVQVHPIPKESACLLILDRGAPESRPSSRRELTLVDLNHPAPRQPLPAAPRSRQASSEWGQTIPLGVFRIDPGHGDAARDTGSSRTER